MAESFFGANRTQDALTASWTASRGVRDSVIARFRIVKNERYVSRRTPQTSID
jgi:hypothetical protein